MSVAPILRSALVGGALLAGAVALVGGVAGFAAAGVPGALGALLGAGLAASFLGLTAVSILVAARASGGDLTRPAFFGIVLGVWFIKVITLLFTAFQLRGQQWFDPRTYLACLLVAVLGSLVIDAVALLRTRVPYVSDVELPYSEGPKGGAASDRQPPVVPAPGAGDQHREP